MSDTPEPLTAENRALDAWYEAHINAVYHSAKGRAKALANASSKESWRRPLRAALATLDAARAPLDDAQAALPDGWTIMVGYTVECSFCHGWWATASKRLDEPPHYPKIVSSETGRPRGEHHDATSADALKALAARLGSAAP